MSEEYPKDVYVSLEELLQMSRYAKGFSFRARKQKVRSILAGKYASKLRGRGIDFEEVRQYVPGDDIRNIDWKVTARTQKTHSKVFTEEKEKPVLIVVDQSKSMFFGSVKKTKSVVAAELAAMIAFKIQKEGDRVGGLIFTDQGADAVLPKRNKKNTLKLLERIVHHNHNLKQNASGDRSVALREAISKLRNIVTHDFLIVVISDFVYYSDEVVKNLSRLAQHNDVLLAKVFDPIERKIPREKMIVGDGNHQIMVDGQRKKVSEKFTAGFDQDLTDFETKMKKFRIPLIRMSTIDPVDEQIKSVFNSHE